MERYKYHILQNAFIALAICILSCVASTVIIPQDANASYQLIQSAQQRLNEMGYNSGTADGVMGQKTVRALKYYQVDSNLEVTGKLDAATIKSLGFSTDRSITRRETKTSRLALVIGNSQYKSAPLKNPVNDARDIATVLKGLDFDVIKEINATQRTMEEAIARFGKKLYTSEIGLFFYAGHGMQIDGTNYLIPIDARCESPADIRYEAVHAERVLAQMQQAKNKLNIVILDACRDNPFRTFRSSKSGLAQMHAPKGSIVAYATAPGSVSADGRGRNGLYTSHLLRNLRKEGQTIQQVFQNTGLSVMQASSDKQIPWVSSTPMSDFYLKGKGTGGNTSQPLIPPSPSPGSNAEIVFWESIKDSDNRLLFNAYLKKFPNGLFHDIALIKLEEVSGFSTGSSDTETMSSKPSKTSDSANIINRDGVYMAYANGNVRDTNTGLEWKVGPDKSMIWNEARSWVQSLGSDWRMPTINELKKLYKKGKGNRNMTPLLKTTGWYVWSGETEGSSASWDFRLNTGYKGSDFRSPSKIYRAFAVRSRGDG